MNEPSPRLWRDRYRARAHERFARAVDPAAEADPGGPSDPKLAGELAVVSMLRRAAPEPPGLDEDARLRLRAKVLAGAAGPRLSPRPEPRSEPGPKPVRTPGTPSPRPRSIGTAGPRGRLLVALAAVFCLVLALSGMAMLASENALPGDPLYGVRRTVESATLGLTSGQLAQGNKHLEFATDRVSDLETLVAQHPDPDSAPVGDYLTGFADFDSDAAAGALDLDDYGAANASNVLAGLRDWGGNQADRITALLGSLPAAALTAANRSIDLLGRIQTRAAELLTRTACYTVTSGTSDDLGVLPATGTCDRRPGVAGAPATSYSGTPEDLDQHPGYTGPTGSVAPSGVAGTTGPTEAPTTFQPGAVLAPTPPNLTQPPATTTPPGLLPLPTLSLPTLLPGA